MRFLFEKLHSVRVLRIAFAVLFLCMIGFGIIMGDALDGKTGFAGMQTTFSVTKLQGILAEWGEEGVQAYLASMYIDFIFPIAYAVALASGISLLSIKAENAANPTQNSLLAFSLPLAAGFCDIIENSFHLLFLPNPIMMDGVLVFLSALAATIKYVLLVVTFLNLAAYAYQRWLARRPVSE